MMTKGLLLSLYLTSKTVTRWANSGKLTSIRTLGGHRRYLESEVRSLLDSIPTPRNGMQDNNGKS